MINSTQNSEAGNFNAAEQASLSTRTRLSIAALALTGAAILSPWGIIECGDALERGVGETSQLPAPIAE